MFRASHAARRPATAERGFALLVVIFLVLLLAGLSLALVEEGVASKTAIRHHETSLQALEILEAGLVRATQEIRSLVDSGDDGIGTVVGTLGGGSYSVTATQDDVNLDRYLLSGTAIHGLSARRIEVAIRRRTSARWVEGLFSKDSLSFRGDTASDSYDSRLGSYASQAVNSDGSGPYALDGGHIGSNGSIDLRGTSVTGDQMPRELPIDIEPISEAAFRAALTTNDNDLLAQGSGGPGGNGHGNGGGNGNGNGGSSGYDPSTYELSVTNHTTLVLASGTYFLSSLTLGSQSTLRVQGPVTLYCTGNVDLTAGTVLNDGPPADFKLYVAPYPLPQGHLVTQPEVRLRGGSTISAAIFAPDATLDIGGGCQIFGAAVAETVRIHGDCSFHYDNALGEAFVSGVATIERLYWREVSVPRR
jgi:hypothetical protein